MKLFHRTDAARAIAANGFRDGRGTYLTSPPTEHQGVWLSNIPLDANEGAIGDTLFMVDIPEDVIAEYEWIDGYSPYREFLVPAAIVNRHGPRALSSEEEDAIPDPRFSGGVE